MVGTPMAELPPLFARIVEFVISVCAGERGSALNDIEPAHVFAPAGDPRGGGEQHLGEARADIVAGGAAVGERIERLFRS